MLQSLSLLQPWTTGYHKATELNAKVNGLVKAALLHAEKPMLQLRDYLSLVFLPSSKESPSAGLHLLAVAALSHVGGSAMLEPGASLWLALVFQLSS